MEVIQSGGNAIVSSQENTVIQVTWSPEKINGFDVDVSAFLLKSDNKVRHDHDFIFYNQSKTTDGSVTYTRSGPKASFQVNITSLPSDISKISFALTIIGKGCFSAASSLEIQVGSQIKFSPKIDSMAESSLILGELYKRQGQWKFRAVGQGFVGGLAPLATHFGVDVNEDSAEDIPNSLEISQSEQKQSTVNLSKITLEKSGDVITLEKRPEGHKSILVNLNWSHQAKEKIDLDLSCFIELNDSMKNVVQALGKRFGSFEKPPYVELLGDDRSGASTDGENVRINGTQWTKIKRILVIASIYEGAADWDTTDGVVRVGVEGQPPLEVRLTRESDQKSSKSFLSFLAPKEKYYCAIARIENVNSNIEVTKEARYFTSMKELDKFYKWGFRWTTGKK